MPGSKGRSTGDEVLIGGIFPLTGYLSWSGAYKRKAAELKCAMINETGGIDGRRLRLVAFDDQSSPEQAARIAETLIFRHGVIAMVGTGSLPVSSAVARVANRHRIPAFLSSGYLIDPVKDLFVFNTAHKTEFAVACSFRYFLEKGISRVGFLMPAGPLGDLGSWLGRQIGGRLGIKVVGEERFDVTEPDVVHALERLRGQHPLALFSFVTGKPAAAVARSMAQLAMNLPLLVSHGNANPGFLKLVSHTPVPLIVPSGKTMVLDVIPEDDPSREILADFNARHLARYGEPANYYSAELADAIDLVAEGLRQAGQNPQDLRDAVEGLRRFGGMQGTYDFSPLDHYGTRLEHMVLLTIKSGRWHFEKTFSTVAGVDELEPDRRGRLIFSLADLLSGPRPDGYTRSVSASETGIQQPGAVDELPEIPPHGDALAHAKLFCGRKREMMQAVRDDDAVKARRDLHGLLTLALSEHGNLLEQAKLSVLELFFALCDVALEEGVALDTVARLKHRFAREWEQAADRETLCLWIVRALDRILDSLSKVGADAGSGLLRKVLRYIRAHHSGDLTVEDVAREVCLSPSRLVHRMNSQYGLTIGDCIARVRTERAKYLLKASDMPISKVGHEVGYRDQSYFTKVFRKRVGCTPREFRASAATLPPELEDAWS